MDKEGHTFFPNTCERNQRSGVRLDANECRALAGALRGVRGRFYLFGSRTDATKRGGDIDLLVVAKTDSAYRLSREITVSFQIEVDEKIDVTVVSPEEFDKNEKPFLRLIRNGLVEFLV